MTGQPLKLLLVEDEAAYADALREILMQSAASQFELLHVNRLSEMLARVKSERFDLMLLDLSLPDRKGLPTYVEAHAADPSLPIIVLTGFDDEKLALQAVREGAQDYLVKGQVDGKMLARVIRYAIERKRAEEARRQSEEVFRLISENVTDLIAVINQDGTRLYNSPSYKNLLGSPTLLQGTNSFEEIHPEDRPRVKEIFGETIATGIGQRAEYRMQLKDGSVRHIESQGSVIRDESGQPSKVVVVSRDITERKETVEVLRTALSDLKRSHEELKAAQLQLIQAEKLEAVSTFAAGVAHEVKNPLQTIILGVDYLSAYTVTGDEGAIMVLNDMATAVQRADAIIRGLLEFSAYKKRCVQDEDLNAIVEQSLRAIEPELMTYPILVRKELTLNLPLLRLDSKTMKHVFINLYMNAIRAMPEGGTLTARTCVQRVGPQKERVLPAYLKDGDTIVVAEVEDTGLAIVEQKTEEHTECGSAAKAAGPGSGLGLTVLKKIIELYGGFIEITPRTRAGMKFTMMFKAHKKEQL